MYSIFCNTSDFSKMGVAYALYFDFVKYCGLILIILGVLAIPESVVYEIGINGQPLDCTIKSVMTGPNDRKMARV